MIPCPHGRQRGSSLAACAEDLNEDKSPSFSSLVVIPCLPWAFPSARAASADFRKASVGNVFARQVLQHRVFFSVVVTSLRTHEKHS